MDHFAVLTPHEQLVETVLYIGQGIFNQGYMELSVDHLDHVENHWFNLRKTKRKCCKLQKKLSIKKCYLS